MSELRIGVISTRTKVVLQAVKARGVKLGNNPGNMLTHGNKGRTASLASRVTSANDRANDFAAILRPLMSQGQSLRTIAATLDAQGIKTARGSHWTAAAVSRVIRRLAA